jgi:hypothetical protein
VSRFGEVDVFGFVIGKVDVIRVDSGYARDAPEACCSGEIVAADAGLARQRAAAGARLFQCAGVSRSANSISHDARA